MMRTLKNLWHVAHAAVRERAKRKTRSPKWHAVQKAAIAAHPRCAACGGTTRLQVHHIQPYHLHPELELDPANLVVLCASVKNCDHLHIGHGGNFRAWNPAVRIHAAAILKTPAQRPLVEKAARAGRRVDG